MEDEQLVTTAETEEAVKAIATSAQFLLRYQMVLATLAPSIGTQLLAITEEIKKNLWTAYIGAGAIYGERDEGLERWLMEMSFLINSKRKAAEIIVEHSLLQQLGGGGAK